MIKYFALRQYGGIYIDMDNVSGFSLALTARLPVSHWNVASNVNSDQGCSASLEPLLYYPAFTIDGGQGALSNNIVGGQPGHPFFVLLTASLDHWNWDYLFPYVTIMFASGQWYLTAIWEEYHSLLEADGSVRGFKDDSWRPLSRVLNDLRPGADRLIFFTQTTGESWADWDYRLLKAIGDYILVIVAFAWSLAGLAIWYYVRRKTRQVDGREYKALFA